MLKFQVKSSGALTPKLPRAETSPPIPPHRTLIYVRAGQTPSCSSSASGSSLDLNSQSSSFNSSYRFKSTSLSSLSSIDSGDMSEYGYVRIFTENIKSDTDYKTLKITNSITVRMAINMVMAKFRMTYKDCNLFRLCMEVQTRHQGEYVKTLLELDNNARILELQRCHPQKLSRFVLVMVGDAVLVRIDDSALCPQSNYKSLLLARETTALETVRLLLQLCRISGVDEKRARLYLHHEGIEAPLPDEISIAEIYMDLLSNQKIVLKKF